MANQTLDPKEEQQQAADTGRQPLPPSDEGLRHMTGINSDQEAAMDKRARAPAAGGGGASSTDSRPSFYTPAHDRVYDPGDNLNNNSTGRPRPDLGPGYDSPYIDPADPRGGLQQAESGAGSSRDSNKSKGSEDPNDGGLYNDDEPNRRQRADAFLNRNRRKIKAAGLAGDLGLASLLRKNQTKLLVGGVAGGTGVAGLFVAIFTLLPLKIEHIINNLQDNFFASSMDAVSTSAMNLTRRYMIDYAIPAYKNCGSTRDINCKVRIVSSNGTPPSNLFKAMSENYMERKLARKGIYFEKRADGNMWLRYPGSGGVDAGPDGKNADGAWEKMANDDRKSIKAKRGQVANSIEGIGKTRAVMYRYMISSVASGRYGGQKMCIVFCFVKDIKHTSGSVIDDFTKTFEIYLNQRVIMPRNASLGVAIECILTGCNPVESKPTTSADAPGQNGAPRSETEGKMTQVMGKLVEAVGGQASFDEADKHYKKAQEMGYYKYLVQEGLSSVVGKTAGRLTVQIGSKAIPILGQLDLAATIAHTANEAGPTIRKLSYLVNAYAAFQVYQSYATYSSEIHTGKVDAAQVGSAIDSLSPGNRGDKNDPLVGGPAGAEGSPLYQALFNTGDKPSDDYICQNGKTVPKGKLVCDEEAFAKGNAQANLVEQYVNSCPALGEGDPNIEKTLGYEVATLGGPCPKIVLAGAEAFYDTVGAGFRAGGDLLGGALSAVTEPVCDITGFIDDALGVKVASALAGGSFCLLKDSLATLTPTIVNMLANVVIQNPFGTNMGGGRKFDMMAAGNDVVGNDYAQIGLGATQVSSQEIGDIRQRQKDRALTEFQSKPLFARLFSTEDAHSLISRIAMATPLELRSSGLSGIANLFSNPLSMLGRNLASLLSGRAGADVVIAEDPFGIPQKGYPPGTIPENPVAYWDQFCADKPDQAYQNDYEFANNNWLQQVADNAGTTENGMPQASRVNPCLLIRASISAMGATFDQDLLTPAERKMADPGFKPEETVATGSLPQGDARKLAEALKPFVGDKITCPGTGEAFNHGCSDILDTANGKSLKGTGSCDVETLDPTLLGVMLYLVQNGHSFGFSALCSDHSSNPTSLHRRGTAADFGVIDGVQMGGTEAAWSGARLSAPKKLMQDAAAVLPKGSNVNQTQCHPAWPFLSKFNTSYKSDACHHQHLDVGSQ